MQLPPVVSPAEWEAARAELLAAEKDATRAHDVLAARRRRLPLVEFDADHRFAAPDGTVTLLDLFNGRRQLIVYHFMFEPGGAPCEGCSFFADQVGHLAHLYARDTSFALSSRATPAEIEAFGRRMGWTIPWYSTLEEGFNAACGITTAFGLSVFLRDGARVFRSYFTSGRGVEALGSAWTFLDLTPLGRQETWEDSPPGYPQTPPYDWWRLHDEYDTSASPVSR
jgi:predicted dithiol-disulfide oxidoreductase (DUF899 family)